MKTVDYFLEALKYHGGRNDGFLTQLETTCSCRPQNSQSLTGLTDQPIGIKLSDDDYVKVRYDAKAMRWIANRPSRIKYPTARELIKQYRREYAATLR